MNTENNYQATDLGNISPNPRGDYDASASYEYLDLVNMDGGSYICLAELGTTVTGVSPEPGKTTETWQCIALPGDLTPEYIAMHDDVVNKAESVAEDTKNVTEMHENVTGMESNVQELQKQAAQSAEEAEASKDAAAGYARAADASLLAAEEAEANVNAQVTGFDSHVAEKTEESERAIAEARQASVEVVSAATNTAANAAERAGSAASAAEEAKTAAAGSKTNAAASASASKTSETNAKASEEAAKAAMQAAQDAAAGVAADREQIAALTKTRSSAIVQTASGTAIVAQDSSDDPVRGLRVFGRTTQDGTPAPDAPVPLVSAGDAGSVEVGVYGSNLLDYEQWKKVSILNGTCVWENNGVTLTATGVDCYTRYSKENNTTIYCIPCNPSETYILTWEHTGNDLDHVYVFYNGVSNNNKSILSKYGQLEFTIPKDCTFFTFRVGCYIVGTTSHYKNVRLSIKDARDFEPYAHQSLTLQTPNGLPGIPVNDESIANYTDADGQMWCSDEVDFERGVYVQRVKKVIFNGGFTRGQKGSFLHSVSPVGFNIEVNTQNTLIAVLCGHYEANTWAYVNSNHNNGCALSWGGTSIGIVDDSFTNVNDFNAYVAENPITALYILATPIETPLTESELAAYQSLHSNYLVTTVLNDAGAHMEFSYNADPKNYIAAEHAKMEAAFDAKLAEIIALLPAETQAAMIENETTNLLNESEE